ncbi:MAG TPA: hypothetical protein VK577_04715 [Bradyrhizobium sp.]|nr:hypothetical protein [Bradyrhizobium sp.]
MTTIVTFPVFRIDRASEEQTLSPQMELLNRIRWAIDDCTDDDHPGIAGLLEEARVEILRLSALTSTPGEPAQRTLPDRERLAEILFTAAHKGLRNCWKWSNPELDHEHPTSRGYWYKIADGTLATLTSTDRT